MDKKIQWMLMETKIAWLPIIFKWSSFVLLHIWNNVAVSILITLSDFYYPFKKSGEDCLQKVTLRWIKDDLHLATNPKDNSPQKWKLCHQLLTLHLMEAIDFHCIFSILWSQCFPWTVWLPSFFKISSFVANRRTKLLQIWNNLRASKW